MEQALEWSPDGKYIGFLPDRIPRPNVVDVATGQTRQLVNFVTREFDWSPDGKKLVIQNQDLYTVNVDGQDLRGITFTTFGAEKNAQWSPDGQRIAYLWEGASGS